MRQLLGIPFDINSSYLRGAAQAPPRIRQMDIEGSANTSSELAHEVSAGKFYIDLGDLPFKDEVGEDAYQLINRKVAQCIQPGDTLLCLGGDHSISFPIIDAHAKKYAGLNVLHIDAHPDLYENFEGNRYSHASPFARLMESGNIASLTQVGIRTFNQHQREQAKRYNVRTVEMKDFTFNFISDLRSPLYLSFDMDALDPAFAPGVSHHEPGGLTTREVLQIIQALPKLVGADIVEYNPSRDVNNVTAMVAYKLMKEIMTKL